MVDNMRAVSAILLQFLAVVHCHNGIPVIIWGNSGAQLPNSLAAHATSKSDFSRDYLQPLKDLQGHNLVTFIQDKLSLDDITQNGDVYNTEGQGGSLHNLKGLVETHSSVSLPSVDGPAESLESLSQGFTGKRHVLTEPYDLRSLSLDPSGANLITVQLPPSTSSAGIRDIDSVLGSVTAALKKLGPSFTAIYTGRKNSQSVQSAYLGRHLLQTADAQNATFLNLTKDGCSVFLYTSQASYSSDGGKTTAALPNTNVYDTAASTCANNTALLVWSYNNLANSTNLVVKMEFVLKSTGYWSVKYLNATLGGSTTSRIGVSDIWAPQFYSYHCTAFSDGLSASNSTKNAAQDVMLYFDDFQVQFGIKGDAFGQANDCVGLFTIPILMGLFVTLILISILTFGMLMLASINTMDRFDDPKGKTITVPVGE